MKAWQRQIRERKAVEEAGENLFGNWWATLDVSMEKAELRSVDYSTAAAVIEEYEWLGTMCSNFVRAYGIFWDGNCGGVVVYGSTVNNMTFAKSTCGKNYVDKILQLQRGACTHWAHPHAASHLIAYSLREEEKIGTRIVVAFSDPEAGEIGTVYQATNWLYCGLTTIRPEYVDLYGKLVTGPVGSVKNRTDLKRRQRLQKGRYIYLLGDRRERRTLRKNLLWEPQPYAKRTAHSVQPDDVGVDEAIPT